MVKEIIYIVVSDNCSSYRTKPFALWGSRQWNTTKMKPLIGHSGSFSLSLPCAKSSTHHLWLGWLKCSCCLSCLVVILGARLPCSFQKSTTTTTKSKANLLCATAPTVTSFVGLYMEYTLNMLREMSLLGTKCSPSYKHSLWHLSMTLR